MPRQEYSAHKQAALKQIGDEKDWPFLALAMAENTPVWSNDKHFINQKQVKNYTTKQLIEKFLQTEAKKDKA